MVSTKECLKGIAQVIAECDGEPQRFRLTLATPDRSDLLGCTGCDYENLSREMSLPIHCIFSDGFSFEFFKYERTPNPTFLRGCFHGDPDHLQRGLQISDFRNMETSLPFIIQLRSICETIFDVMLSAYITGLKAYCDRSEKRGREKGSKRPSLDQWNLALQTAERALTTFRDAEGQRKQGDPDAANSTVAEAVATLQERYYYFRLSARLIYRPLSCLSIGALPTRYQLALIMKDWNDVEVEKA
jgi:hypothetical protein